MKLGEFCSRYNIAKPARIGSVHSSGGSFPISVNEGCDSVPHHAGQLRICFPLRLTKEEGRAQTGFIPARG